jgi:hypothetical protein
MAERASIFQTVQIGVETTAGVSVAASKKLQSMMIEPGPQAEIASYRAMGSKFPSLAALGKEWTEANVGGGLTYTELIYPLSSVLKAVSPTGTTVKTWTFSPATSAADTVKTFTVEQGSSERAHKFVYGLFTSLGMKFSRDGSELSGSMLGAAITDGITMTATPTTIDLIPVLPTQVKVYLADTYAGLTGATALARAMSVEWNISDRFGPVWALNGATTWAAFVETEPKLEVKLLMEADAEGMALLATMRSGATKFVRIEAVGATIGAGPDTLKLTVDTACKVTEVDPFSDEDGVFAIGWTLSGFHDGTWGKATEVVVINELATL